MVEEKELKEVFILDDKGFFIGTTYLDIEEKQEFKFTSLRPDENLIKPKFDGEKWIEGVDKNDLMLNMLFPENDLGVNPNDFLVLNILKILREGG